MEGTAFQSYLAAQKALGLYPSRLEGRTVRAPFPGWGLLTVPVFRARFGQDTVAPQYMYGQSCDAVSSAIKAAPASTPLVSLQRYYDAITSSYYYQAVWSAPIPQLPAH